MTTIELLQNECVPSEIYNFADGSVATYPWNIVHNINDVVWGLNPTVSELDFERVPSFTLALKITDQRGATAFGNIAILVLDDNEAPSLSEQGVVRTLKEHSSPTTRIPHSWLEMTKMVMLHYAACSIEPTPSGNSLFQWFGGVRSSSWVSNCVMVVKDKLATEAIDYESLTADENGHRTIDVKIEVKDIKGLTLGTSNSKN